MENDKGLIISQNQPSLTDFKKGVDNLLEQRKYFIEQVQPILTEKQDYYAIKLGGEVKKSLAKGGAEKLASIWNLVAKFERDNEALEMLKDVAPKGLVAYRCDLFRGDILLGQGRGADWLARNQNDPNKTIKMAQKRAYIDAVIRTTGLSDIFTQDLESMEIAKPKAEVKVSRPQAVNVFNLAYKLGAPVEKSKFIDWVKAILGLEIAPNSKDWTDEEVDDMLAKLRIILGERRDYEGL